MLLAIPPFLSLIALIVIAVLLICFVYWTVTRLCRGFGVGEPVVSVFLVLLVLGIIIACFVYGPTLFHLSRCF